MRVAHALVLLAALRLVGHAPCQERTEPRRRRLAGVVLDANSKPVAGAQVTLLSRPWPSEPRIEGVDRVRVTTDVRGRFNALILTARAYSVWAFADAGDGRYRATDIAEDVFAGRTIRLRLLPEPRRALRVRVTGVERWKASGPLSYELLSTAPRNVVAARLAADADGLLPLPRLPGTAHELRVASAAGSPIAVVRLAAEDLDRASPVALSLPEPRSILVRVKDDAGEPVAAAAVLAQVGGQRFPIGTTNAEGWASVGLPFRLKLGAVEASVEGRVWALAPTFAEKSGTVSAGGDPERDLAAMRERGEADLSLELQKGGTVVGRILAPGGEPARRLPLLLWSPVSTRKNSYSHVREPVLYRTDEEGRFRLPGRHPRCNLRLCAVLPGEILGAMPSKPGFPRSPIVWLYVGGGPAEAKLDLGDLQLGRLEAVDVEARGPDGGPAEFPRILVGTREMHPFGGIGVLYPMELLAGRRGRLRLFLPKTSDLALGILSPAGFAGSDLVLPPGPGDPPRSPLVVQVAEGREIRGRVTRPDGSGVEAALVRIGVASSGGAGATRLLAYASAARTVATDAEGRFRAKIGSVGQYSFSATVRIENRSYRSAGSVRADGAADGATHGEVELGEVELEIAAPPGKGELAGASGPQRAAGGGSSLMRRR